MGWFDNFFYGKKMFICNRRLQQSSNINQRSLLFTLSVPEIEKNLRLVFSCKWENVNVKIINAEEMYDSNKDLYKTIMGWNWMEKLFGLFVSVIHYLIYPLLNLPWSKLKRELLHLHWNKKSWDEKWK